MHATSAPDTSHGSVDDRTSDLTESHLSHRTRARAAMRADVVASRASEHEELAARMDADAERESGEAATLCRAIAVVNRRRAACERECAAIYRRVAGGGQP